MPEQSIKIKIEPLFMRLPRRGVYKLLHQTRIGINHDEFESLIHIIVLTTDSDLQFWVGD